MVVEILERLNENSIKTFTQNLRYENKFDPIMERESNIGKPNNTFEFPRFVTVLPFGQYDHYENGIG